MYLNVSSSYPSPVYGLTGDDMWKNAWVGQFLVRALMSVMDRFYL